MNEDYLSDKDFEFYCKNVDTSENELVADIEIIEDNGAYRYTELNAFKRPDSTRTVLNELIPLLGSYFKDMDYEKLIPITYNDLAKRTGLNVSTVKLCLSELIVKYAQFKYPLSYLLTSHLFYKTDGTAISQEKLHTIITDIIFNELDTRLALSDSDIAKVVATKGIEISHKLVSRVRHEHGLNSKAGRQEFLNLKDEDLE
jgi:DNA-directed RNA polymerase specialized sigma54-like protein